jgi:hypothetical protein
MGKSGQISTPDACLWLKSYFLLDIKLGGPQRRVELDKWWSEKWQESGPVAIQPIGPHLLTELSLFWLLHKFKFVYERCEDSERNIKLDSLKSQ